MGLDRRLRLFAFAVLAVVLAGCGAGASRSSSRVVPYADVTIAPSQLSAEVHRSGVRVVSLAFVLAGNGCNASWGGQLPIADPAIRSAVQGVRSVISFGGRDGPELAQRCSTAGALAAQYERVVDAFHAVRADFDIERGTLGSPSAVARRSQAIAALEAHERAAGRRLAVSLTLPADEHGLTPDSVEVIRSALAAHAQVQLVNLLAMDFGPPAGPGQMGRLTIETAISSERQLKDLLPDTTAARVWGELGMTAMIGRNDVSSEVFAPRDVAEVVRFAQRHHVGALSFWSLARDRSCSSATSSAQDSCSGVSQAPFEFTHLFAAYSG